DQAKWIAFREMPFSEFVTAQTGRWFAEWLRLLIQGPREDAPPLSADEGLLVEKLVEDARQAYIGSSLTERQLLGWLRTGMGDPKGWEELLRQSPKEVRGPLAYTFACCYRGTHKNPKQADLFLRSAARDAAGNLPLARLLKRKLADGLPPPIARGQVAGG